uniref:RING-type domain-containing protein n=1 Tax=Macrostomum lignano TaxID=282301 RepID=A0A1I8IXX1_9PLAT
MATTPPAPSFIDAASAASAAVTMATRPTPQPTPQSLLDGPFWIGAIALVGLLLLLGLVTCIKRQYEDDLSRCRLFRWKASSAVDAEAADGAFAMEAATVGSGYQARQYTGVTAFDFDLEAGEVTPSNHVEGPGRRSPTQQSPTLQFHASSPLAVRSSEVTAAEADEAAEAEAAMRALADEVASRLALRTAADSVLFTVDSPTGEEGGAGSRRCSSKRRAFARNRTTTMASAGTSESAATAATGAAESSSRRRSRRHRRSRDGHGGSVCGGSRSCIDFAAMSSAAGDAGRLNIADNEGWNGGGSSRRRRGRRCRRCCQEEAEAEAEAPGPPAEGPLDTSETAANRRQLLDRLVRQASAGCTCRRCWRRFQAEVLVLRARFHGEGGAEAGSSCGQEHRRRSRSRRCLMAEDAEPLPALQPRLSASSCCGGEFNSGVASWLLAQQPTAAEARAKGAQAVKCNSIEDMSCAAAKAAAAEAAAADELEEEQGEAGSQADGRERRNSSRQLRRQGRERRRRRSVSAVSCGPGTDAGVARGRVEELANRRLERFRAELRQLCESAQPRPPPPMLLAVPPISSAAAFATEPSAAAAAVAASSAKSTYSTKGAWAAAAPASASAAELCPPRLASPTPSLEDVAGDCRSPIVAGDTFIYVEDWSRRATESHSAILPAAGRQLRQRQLLRLRRRALEDDNDNEFAQDFGFECLGGGPEHPRESGGDTASVSSRQSPTSEAAATATDAAAAGAAAEVQLSIESAPTQKPQAGPPPPPPPQPLNRQGSCRSSCSSSRNRCQRHRGHRRSERDCPTPVKARLGDSAYQTKENSADMPPRAAGKLQEVATIGDGSAHCCCCCRHGSGCHAEHHRRRRRSSSSKSLAADGDCRSCQPEPQRAIRGINSEASIAAANTSNSRSLVFTNFEEELEVQAAPPGCQRGLRQQLGGAELSGQGAAQPGQRLDAAGLLQVGSQQLHAGCPVAPHQSLGRQRLRRRCHLRPIAAGRPTGHSLSGVPNGGQAAASAAPASSDSARTANSAARRGRRCRDQTSESKAPTEASASHRARSRLAPGAASLLVRGSADTSSASSWSRASATGRKPSTSSRMPALAESASRNFSADSTDRLAVPLTGGHYGAQKVAAKGADQTGAGASSGAGQSVIGERAQAPGVAGPAQLRRQLSRAFGASGGGNSGCSSAFSCGRLANSLADHLAAISRRGFSAAAVSPPSNRGRGRRSPSPDCAAARGPPQLVPHGAQLPSQPVLPPAQKAQPGRVGSVAAGEAQAECQAVAGDPPPAHAAASTALMLKCEVWKTAFSERPCIRISAVAPLPSPSTLSALKATMSGSASAKPCGIARPRVSIGSSRARTAQATATNASRTLTSGISTCATNGVDIEPSRAIEEQTPRPTLRTTTPTAGLVSDNLRGVVTYGDLGATVAVAVKVKDLCANQHDAIVQEGNAEPHEEQDFSKKILTSVTLAATGRPVIGGFRLSLAIWSMTAAAFLGCPEASRYSDSSVKDEVAPLMQNPTMPRSDTSQKKLGENEHSRPK